MNLHPGMRRKIDLSVFSNSWLCKSAISLLICHFSWLVTARLLSCSRQKSHPRLLSILLWTFSSSSTFGLKWGACFVFFWFCFFFFLEFIWDPLLNFSLCEKKSACNTEIEFRLTLWFLLWHFSVPHKYFDIIFEPSGNKQLTAHCSNITNPRGGRLYILKAAKIV